MTDLRRVMGIGRRAQVWCQKSLRASTWGLSQLALTKELEGAASIMLLTFLRGRVRVVVPPDDPGRNGYRPTVTALLATARRLMAGVLGSGLVGARGATMTKRLEVDGVEFDDTAA
jgi:hypothetical protein